MKQSSLFTKTRKEAPKDEVAKNAELLIRAGYIHKEMAGVYSYLPLGLRVLHKIENIIRAHMNAAGGQELLMTAFQPKENWQKTGRWDSMDDLYKVSDSSGREVALGPTHEEIVVPLVKQFISSYKDLPLSVYQIQNKFRMELRAKSGILRGREFMMKDMYSFHADEKDFSAYYEKMKGVYADIFKAAGIGEKTYITFASGGTFSKYSHEFQTVTDAGEDVIYVCEKCRIAINKEVRGEQKTCPQCDGNDFSEKRAIEVGNIFDLKTKYSAPFEATFKDEKGQVRPILMGCYGIGLGRLMGVIVEIFSDEKGIAWPHAVAPFTVHLIEINPKKNPVVAKEAADLYDELTKDGVEVLWDDREMTAGEKFADADLIGIPTRLVVSEKTVNEKVVEMKLRTEKDAKKVAREKIAEHL